MARSIQTQHIVVSLARNPKSAGEQPHFVDDFIWRKGWIDQHVLRARSPMHACFRHLLEKYMAKVQHLLKVRGPRSFNRAFGQLLRLGLKRFPSHSPLP
jgi:hypothetical protein